MSRSASLHSAGREPQRAWFGGLAGAFLGLTLLKFGNPVILDRMVEKPGDPFEFLLQPWPVAWGYGLLGLVAIASLAAGQVGFPKPRWLVSLPLVWLVWQCISASVSVNSQLSRVTLLHFTASVACFYLGLFALARVRLLSWFCGGLLAGFLVMLWTGFGQHYGGLEATRTFVLGSPRFGPSHFADFPGFASRLNSHPDEVSKYLWERCSEGTRQALAAFQGQTDQPSLLETNLAQQLNEIISNDRLFQKPPFKGIALSFETKTLIDQGASGERLARLNRLLLEDAYPREIRSYHIASKPDWKPLPPEHLKRINSNRIFATLLYPNTLAGVLLLLAPVMCVATWQLSRGLTQLTRGVLVGLVAYGSIACLIWSGSKAGWLIALLLTIVCLLQLRFRQELKLLLVGVLLLGGLAGFFARFSRYFSMGATSVSARFEYWRAAVATTLSHPWFGTGPGTFSVAYRQLKPPDAEMALLAHNDYLEQASDSGVLGALIYVALVGGSLAALYCRSRIEPGRFAVWLGLTGWALQSFVEFGLYIPAIGWTAFLLLGWLHAVGDAENGRAAGDGAWARNGASSG